MTRIVMHSDPVPGHVGVTGGGRVVLLLRILAIKVSISKYYGYDMNLNIKY